MILMVNGKSEELKCKTVSTLLEALGHRPESVATAVNGEFIPIAERDNHRLEADDAVDIIAPMAGG